MIYKQQMKKQVFGDATPCKIWRIMIEYLIGLRIGGFAPLGAFDTVPIRS